MNGGEGLVLLVSMRANGGVCTCDLSQNANSLVLVNPLTPIELHVPSFSNLRGSPV